MSVKKGIKSLWFHVELLQVYFTQPGRYFLKLGIKSTKGERDHVQLYVNEASNPVNDSEVSTDSSLVDDVKKSVKFKDSKFNFCMPADFAAGEIQFNIEAFRALDNSLLDGEKCGQCLFLVYPWPFDAAKQGSNGGNKLYHFETQMPLNQELSTDGIRVNTGVLTAVVSLIQEKKDSSTSKGKKKIAVSGVRQEQIREKSSEIMNKAAEHRQTSLDTPYYDRTDSDRSVKALTTYSEPNVDSLTQLQSSAEVVKGKGVSGMQSQGKVESSASFREPISHSGNKMNEPTTLVNMGKHKVSGSIEKKRLRYSANVLSTEHNTWTASREEGSQNRLELGFDDIRKQQQAGSLANLYQRLSYDETIPDQVNFFTDSNECRIQGGLSRLEQDKQERAGSLANLYIPSSTELSQELSPRDSPIVTHGAVTEAEELPIDRTQCGKENDRLPKVNLTKDEEDLQIHKKVSLEILNAKANIINMKSHREEANYVGENGFIEDRSFKPVSTQVPKFEPLSVLEESSVPGPSTAPDSYEPTDRETIIDPALAISSSVAPLIHLCGSYLARGDNCEVAILVHAAVGLPAKSNGYPPHPYVTACTRGDQERQEKAQSVTHATKQPTHSAAWDEVLVLEFPETQVKREDIVLTIADHPSQEVLAQFRIPVVFLKPFHVYHLELVQPNSELNGDIRLSISVILKKASLELANDDDSTYGLEMTVRGFDSHVSKQMEPLIAVVRLVPDWSHYKNNFLTPLSRPAGVTMTTIHFPSPHPTSFAVAGASQFNGSPQVSVSCELKENPQWNQTFYFPGRESSLFAPGSSLVVEYYLASLVMNQGCWQLANPVGYSHHDLDQSLLSSLKHENGRLGLRLINLAVEGSDMESTIGSRATVELAVRLLHKDKADFPMTAAQLSKLPIYRSGFSPLKPSHEQQFLPSEKNRFGLPASDAVRKLLPNFHSLYVSERPESVKEYVPIQGLDTPTQERDRNYNLEIPEDVRSSLDVRSLAVLDQQMKEVDRYRTAMRKMATDLFHLREDKARLEGINSRLKREVEKHDEISRMMISSHELDNITHSELIQKFALLKTKLADESTKKQELQKRIQHLQNDLIMKNEMEKEFMKLRDAHNGQQSLLQKLQNKVQKTKTLQDTCRKQEKVIVELEQLMARRVDDGGAKGKMHESAVQSLLKEENDRLRAEMLHLKELLKISESKVVNASKTPASFAHTNGTFSDRERLEMFEKLERAEGRILALERELTNNARSWAKEKAELQMKLSESQLALHTGFRNSTTDLQTLHNAFNGSVTTPPISGSRRRTQPPPGPRRPSPKLDPLKRWPEYQ